MKNDKDFISRIDKIKKERNFSTEEHTSMEIAEGINPKKKDLVSAFNAFIKFIKDKINNLKKDDGQSR